MLVSYCLFEQLFNLHNANRIIAGNGRTKKEEPFAGWQVALIGE